jgi:hypothetical protein
VGEGILQEIAKPGRNIADRVNLVLYGIFTQSRKTTMINVLLGNMTKAEFKAGKISDKRLAQLKKVTGRWVDLSGTESVAGSTPEGKAFTKFRQWAVPPLSTISSNLASLARSVSRLGDKTKRVTPEQAQELYRIIEVLAITYLINKLAGDDEDETFLGKMKSYALREMSTIIQSVDPVRWLDAGVTAGYIEQFGANLKNLMTLEKYETTTRWGEKGELKGLKGLQRQITPSGLSQFLGEKKASSGKKRLNIIN